MHMRNTRQRPLRWILSILVVGLALVGIVAVLGEEPFWPLQGIESLPQQWLWVVLLVLGVWLVGLWGLPKWQVAGITDAGERLALETQVRKTFILILGGGLGLVGLASISSGAPSKKHAVCSNTAGTPNRQAVRSTSASA
jgi:hypothetical protein